MPDLSTAAKQQIAETARTTLGIETRYADRLDFHDTAVWSIRAALEAACLAGVAAGKGAARQGDTV